MVFWSSSVVVEELELVLLLIVLDSEELDHVALSLSLGCYLILAAGRHITCLSRKFIRRALL